MPLMIIESPNKIPKLTKLLGKDFEIVASCGHMMELEKKDMGIDLTTFIPKYQISDSKKDVVKKIKEAAKNHDIIYIASDSDMEGEKISDEIYEILPKKGKKIVRITFNELSKKAIEDAIKNPSGFNKNLSSAQETRRVTDRIVGFQVSPILWLKGLAGTSAGRVQSATLRFIVEREKEIKAFKPEEYWSLNLTTSLGFNAEFYAKDGSNYEIKTKVDVDSIINDIQKNIKSLIVKDFTKKTRTRTPSPPFMTSTLLQDSNAKFGWDAKRTMDVAQKIFSAGLISYHRTDSERTEPDKMKELRTKIEADYGKKYLEPTERSFSAKGNAQDAHEAIRPTGEPVPSNLGTDELKLLKLVESRFLASQMADAKFDQALMKLELKGSLATYSFKASGSILKFDGFLKVYGSSSDDLVIPDVKVNQKVGIDKVIPEQHFTKAPGRYNDSSIIDKMKKDGIGRPSTYAPTIEHILEKKYIDREKKAFKATEMGIMVSDYLNHFFPKVTGPKFTADMEEKLDRIALGELKSFDTLSDFYKELQVAIVDAKAGNISAIFNTDTKCTKCDDGVMSKRISKYGVFLACANFPICGHTISYDKDGNPKESEVETGASCPDCGSILKEKKGPFGTFIGCSGYPSCKWIGKIDENGKAIKNEKKKAELTEHKCPNCDKGYFVKRKGKEDKEFYGCSGYPSCKTSAQIGDDGAPDVNKKSSFKKKPSSFETTNDRCPKCKKGDVLIRDGKFGRYKTCSEFKNGCKFTESIKK
jgi:DNA topoisomerase-1